MSLQELARKAIEESNGTTAEAYTVYLSLQTLNKVFLYNNTGEKTFANYWDFVAEGAHGLFMDIDSETAGKNFLYMLTHDQMEAMTLATRICLISNGVLQQYDAPLEVYNRPMNLFAVDFVGNPSVNFVEARGAQQPDGGIALTAFDGRKAVFHPRTPVDGFLLTGVAFGSILFSIGAKIGVNFLGDAIMLFDRKSGKCVALGSLKFEEQC